MAVTVGELRLWLDQFVDSDDVGIDEGGLTLEQVGHPDIYMEVGGSGAPEPPDICPVCELAGSASYIPHGSADAFCTNCGANWQSNS